MDLNNFAKYDYQLLLVEDDAPSRIYSTTLLKRAFDTIHIAENGAEGLELFKKHKPEIVISDINMPVMNGLQMCREIKAISPKTQIILTTAFDGKETLLEAIDIGVNQFILKPVKKDSLAQAIERVAKHLDMEKEIHEKDEYIDTLSYAVEFSSSMVVIINSEGKIDYVNPKFLEITHLEKDSIINDDVVSIFQNYLSVADSKKFADSFTSKEWHGEANFKRKDGEEFWFSISMSTIEQDGVSTHKVVVMDDISHLKREQELLKKSHDLLEQKVLERTQELQETNIQLTNEIEVRKQTESELIAAKEFAEAANKTKDLFLAKVSHELRTPMNGIIGFSSILLDTEMNPKQSKFINMVHSSAESLLKIINDLLDISKIKSGKFKIEKQNFEIRKLVESTQETFKERCKQKNLDLISIIDEQIPNYLFGDPHRLQQILINLLGNSLKFTEKGKIEINLQPKFVDESSIIIDLQVIDTGIGIPKDKIPELFKEFTQVDGTFTRKYGGTGLGLAISKEYVEAMDGAIRVESDENKGTTFTITLPFEIAKNKENEIELSSKKNFKEIADSYPDYPLNILVAEDSYVNQELLREALFSKNWMLTIVSNGNEAIEAAQSSDFDIILMDVQMPEMDGLETTRVLKKYFLKSEIKTPIIGVTAHAGKEGREQCLNAGMDDYISKPFDWNQVFSVIYNHTQNQTDIIDNEFVDIESLMYSINNNKEMFKRIVSYFKENYPKEIGDLKIKIQNSDFVEAKKIIHKFKSEIGNFHAKKAFNISSRLEQLIKSSEIENSLLLLDELNDELKKIDKQLSDEIN